MQISTWVLLPMLVAHFLLFLTPTFPKYISIPFTAIFLLFGIASTWYGYVTTTTDSMDEKLYENLTGKPHKNVLKRRADKEFRRRRRKLMKEKEEEERRQKATEDKPQTITTASSSAVEVTDPKHSPKYEDGDEESNFSDNRGNRAVDSAIGSTLKEGDSQRKEDDTLGMTTSNDSSDEKWNDSVLRSNQNKKDEDSDSEEDEEEDVKYCWVCQTEVHLNSMHCKYCDKCVSNFDHHCMWLNTCIGSENYKTFCYTVIYLVFFSATHALALLLYIILYFTKKCGVKDNSDFSWLVGSSSACSPMVTMIINLVFFVFLLAVCSMVFQLLLFHMDLQSKSLTTYQFIIKDNQDKRERKVFKSRVAERRKLELMRVRNRRRQLQLQNQRTNKDDEEVEVEEAGCGLQLEEIQIQMGEYKLCKPCDPIRQTVTDETAAQAMTGEARNGSSNNI